MNSDPAIPMALSMIVSRETFRPSLHHQRGAYVIGYGFHALPNGEAVGSIKGSITQEQGREWLRIHLTALASRLRMMVHREITDEQAAALLALAWDIGTKALDASPVMLALNTGDYAGAAAGFAAHAMWGGKLVPEWVGHRHEERRVFEGGRLELAA